MSTITLNVLQLFILGLSAMSLGVWQTMRFSKAACLQSKHMHRFHRDVDINNAADRQADGGMERYAVLKTPSGATASSRQLHQASPALSATAEFVAPTAPADARDQPPPFRLHRPASRDGGLARNI
jgi:hypothetical protein